MQSEDCIVSQTMRRIISENYVKKLSDKLMRISGHKENSSTAWMIKVESYLGQLSTHYRNRMGEYRSIYIYQFI